MPYSGTRRPVLGSLQCILVSVRHYDEHRKARRGLHMVVYRGVRSVLVHEMYLCLPNAAHTGMKCAIYMDIYIGIHIHLL